jgi:xylulokinase
MKCILAYDIGGTSLRAGLVSLTGDSLCMTSAILPPLQMNTAGCSEKNPEEWWRNLRDATATLLQNPHAAGAEIAGLSLSGLTRTQIFLDRDGKPVRHALTWADARATEQAERIIQAQARMGPPGKTFGGECLSHMARVLWVKGRSLSCLKGDHGPEPGDYLNFSHRGGQGQISSPDLSAQELGGRRAPGKSVFKGLFPPLRDPWDRLGAVRSGLEPPMDRLAGVPVFVGGMDAWCGALGIGAVRAGWAFNASGTSEVFGVATATFREIAGLVTQPWGKGLFLAGGPSQAGADCLAWYLEAFGGEDQALKPGAALKDLEVVGRQPEPVLFLPYLRGERVPLWQPDARGLFLGLNRRHGRVDFIWAILEGVAFANRQVLELATKGSGEAVQEIRITGGAVESDAWCQTKADVLNLPLVRTRGKRLH